MGEQPLAWILEVYSGDFTGAAEPVMDGVPVNEELFSAPVHVAEGLQVGQQRNGEFRVPFTQQGYPLVPETVVGADQLQQLVDQDGGFHLAEGRNAHRRGGFKDLQDIADMLD